MKLQLKILPNRYFQTGSSTLLISILLLFAASIIVIGVSRTTIIEQRISANEMRARQAFEAAQTGIDHALDYLTATVSEVVPGADRDNDNIADTVTALTYVSPATYRFAYCDPTSGSASCPDSVGAPICDLLNNETNADGVSESVYLKTPLIASCGWSDDAVGRRLIRQNAGTVPAIKSGPTSPLITKGPVNVTGSATITNYYNNLTIWSGGSLTSIGNSGKTYIRNPNLEPPNDTYPPPESNDNNCGASSNSQCYVQVTDKTTIGPDVIAKDPSLNSLTDALMFQNFLGANDIKDYRNNIATMDIKNSEVDILDDGDVKGQSVVIEGNTTLPNGTIGSRDRPVVLIINGDWQGGNVTVYGVVYVMGDINVAGNPKVYGAVVAQNQVTGTGSLDIIYDPYAVKNAKDHTGRSGLISGSWRDW